jgi:hypothetical protein
MDSLPEFKHDQRYVKRKGLQPSETSELLMLHVYACLMSCYVLYFMFIFTMLTCLVFPMVNQAPEVAAKPIAAIALYTWLLC